MAGFRPAGPGKLGPYEFGANVHISHAECTHYRDALGKIVAS